MDFDLLTSAQSRLNPMNERELDLRGFKIQKIENLALTRDVNDCLDFTDNDIAKLGNFPLMPNVKTLLLHNNRISKIESTLSKYLPNLEHLILSKNAIVELGELDPLVIQFNADGIRKAELYVIHKIPSIKVLDYKKVSESERIEALKLFSGKEGNELLKELTEHGMNATFDPEEILETKKTISKEEQLKIREAIKNAKTLSEISRLEQALQGGIIPEL
ncbi:U2 small nuclear ribonucleoprotein [Boothiomyces macroporosus]|uniref:U2 small nuclear ribonucleoprotein A' n=1 Tax=Boothiomyces macroporosus TaxID=261099 RepID=A0AAD5UE69_9FUNG|nr:U2 small nuclear ribonucleoprotein [Boothiomyces macroporosus]